MQAKIELTRVDNRLVHGQVGVSWSVSLNIDTIVVVDDETAQNPLSQKLMQTIAKSANVQIRFYSIEGFAEVFHRQNSTQKLFIVVKTIQVVRKMNELGIPTKKVNVGNIHYERGRYPLNKKMYVTIQDVNDIQYLGAQGCEVFYQDVPGTLVEKLNDVSVDDLKRRRRQ